MKITYNVSNPIERAKVIIDSQKLMGNEKVILFCPENTYVFSNSVEALCYVFYAEDTYIGESYTDRSGIYIQTASGTYSLRSLQMTKYEYNDKDKKFKEDKEQKLKIMRKEFEGKFSEQDFENKMESQALAIVDTHTAIDRKFEDFLNKYIPGQWSKCEVISKNLDKISTQYTLRVYGINGDLIDLTKISKNVFAEAIFGGFTE